MTRFRALFRNPCFLVSLVCLFGLAMFSMFVSQDSSAPSNLAGNANKIVQSPNAVFQDGVLTSGWTKEVLEAGDGKTFPKPGDTVVMHYVGTLLSGNEFDSSRRRNSPFSTVIGRGRVIRGWDLGVPTMSLGEKAVLTIAADHAYGKSGAGGVIPPDATLIFEVELLQIK